MINLRELLDKSGLQWRASSSIEGVMVSGITDDSRRVQPGYLFVAIRGLNHDGHSKIPEVLAAGACAVVYQNNVEAEGVLVKIEDSREALGRLWAAWYGWPSRKLTVIGVTGTEGKTTTCNLIYRVFEKNARKTGLISTISARIGEDELDTGAHVTSPGPEMVQKLLSQMVKSGAEYAVLEVTSHAIDQQRYAGVSFEVAAVTNITRDHLDYHKTFENYREVKAKLLHGPKVVVLNKDDDNFDYLSSKATGEIWSYSITREAKLRAEQIKFVGTGSEFGLVFDGQRTKVQLNLPGEYNVSNALAASGVSLALGLNEHEIASGLAGTINLAGRFEEIENSKGFRVFVDFAHTASALRNVLQAARNIAGSKRVICVFGAPGERDPEKRPLMGEVAGELADISIITMDDPRSERVEDVVQQIAEGCRRVGAVEQEPDSIDSTESNVFTGILNRRDAVQLALKLAKPGDIVLLAGKGHEKMMAMGSGDVPWSDQDVVRNLLATTFGPIH